MTDHRPATRMDPRDGDPRYPDGWYGEHTADILEEARVRRRSSTRLDWSWLIIAVVVITAILTLLAMRAAPSEAPRDAAPAATDAGLRGAPQVEPAARYPVEKMGGTSITPASGGAPQTVIAPALIGGTATWFCGAGSPCTHGYSGSDLIAAIDPGLGIAKGTLVTVTHGSKAVLVRVVDVCQCAGRRLIDLSSGAFSRLAALNAGVIAVTIEIATLPATDMAEEEAIR